MAFDLKKIFSSLQSTAKITPSKIIGIDLGSSSLKVVELEKRDEVVTLSTYGELQLGPYAEAGMGASVKLSVQKKTEAMVDVLRESGVTAKGGVFALPLAESFITIMSLASTGPEEDIAPRVNVEARKYIPVPMNDVALEWSEVTRPTPTNQSLTRDILLVAIQNQAVADNRALLGAIDMASHPSEIELFSCLRANIKPTDTTLAIIDLGAGMSKLYIADGGVLQRIHRVQLGGAQATATIAAQLQLSFEDAENLKRNYDPNHQQASVIKQGVDQVVERALQEFKRVMVQYETRTGMPIARVVVTGGVSVFPGIVQYAAYLLDRSVETSNPFTKIAYPAFMEDTLISIAPSFSIALGAALRQFE